MSVIGLDFGSHASSIALWFEEKDVVEVLADDLGFRTIPSFVAFRSGEVIVGRAAISQYHKNQPNTFEDVRSIILNPDMSSIFIPILEKDVPVQEIASHYFRNVHNQIKQQVGKAVRECVISIPFTLEEPIRQRLVEAAQAGGIRIKSIIQDSASTLLANNFDDPAIGNAATVLVLDIGWSKTEASIYSVNNGLLVPLGKALSANASGKVMVNLLAEHCAKDFQRKTKVPVTEYGKSILRLKRECEESMKHLSTVQEATIDIDSLCEGIDYSTKISRARLEDLCTVPFIHLKNLITEVLTTSKLGSPEDVTHICLTGGLSAMPKILQTVKTIFPRAIYPRGRFELNESQCIGAALHGKYLLQQGLLDGAPTTAPLASGLTRSLLISTSTPEVPPLTILTRQSALPALRKVQASVPATTGYFQLLAGPAAGEEGGSSIPLGEVTFQLPPGVTCPATVTLSVAVDIAGAIVIQVLYSSGEEQEPTTLTTLEIPVAANS